MDDGQKVVNNVCVCVYKMTMIHTQVMNTAFEVLCTLSMKHFFVVRIIMASDRKNKMVILTLSHCGVDDP